MSAPGENPIMGMLTKLIEVAALAKEEGWRFRLVTTPERLTLDMLIPPVAPPTEPSA